MLFKFTEEQKQEMVETMKHEDIKQIMIEESQVIVSLETYDDDKIDYIRFHEDGSVDRRLGQGSMSNFYDIVPPFNA